jgi:membrane fusion protein, multidrug efflux system
MTTKTNRLRLIPAVALALASLSLPACHRSHAGDHGDGKEHGGHGHAHQALVVTSPLVKDVLVTQQYVCQLRSQRHIEVRALQEGYLEPIQLKEGQAVKAGDVLFKVAPALYKARLDAELAEARLAELELNNTRRLAETRTVSVNEVALYEAKLARAQAKAALAQAELDFTVVRAPFDGIVDRLNQQQGSLVKKEEVLTTLSDNEVMWAKFNVPEVRFFEYMTAAGRGPLKRNSRIELADARIELVLANGKTFEHHAGNAVTVEGEFNRETGNIQFRADFPNPEGLLRHGQTGSVLVHRTLPKAVVIPQRATFETLDKRYVFVVGKDDVVRQREIVVSHEMDDIFVVKKGLGAGDRIVLEGVRQVHEGEKIKYETRSAEEALADQKHHAE